MGLDIPHEFGQTPLDEDDKEGLKIPTISTMAELDEFEQFNIEQAVSWLLKKKTLSPSVVFTEEFILDLHKRMFGIAWDWAGKFRRKDTNLGIEWIQIPIELKKLCDDTLFWVEHKVFSQVEIAVRFKHQIVSIHCFPNGNGRHSRMMADIINEKIFGQDPFTWGSHTMEDKERREKYLEALKSADMNDFKPLLTFCLA